MTDAERRAMEDLNQAELVQLCTEFGYRVHRGMPRKSLINLLVSGKPPKRGTKNPFDRYRDRIMRFLHRHEEKLQSQLAVHCKMDCYAHSDMQVLSCWLDSEKVIIEDEGEQDGKG